MDSQSNLTPPLCAKGCGFFGSPEKKNLCSECYRDHVKEEESVAAETAKKLSQLVIDTQSAANDKSPAVLTDETTSSSAAAASSSTVKINRCECCNKKVGLLGFKCRCEKTFCGVHRHATEHSCTFDFKTLDRRILAEQNPLVVSDKLHTRIWFTRLRSFHSSILECNKILFFLSCDLKSISIQVV